MTTHVTRSLLAFAVLALVLLLGGALHNASAAPTTITAFKSQLPVKLDGVVGASEWVDTPLTTDQKSGITFGAKENGTGLLFLMMWNQSSTYCHDASCFGGIELASTSNTLAMGSATAPTIMILTSPSFKGNVDDFISIGTTTPLTVESKGYTTQTICALALAGSVYTAECYRPFTLTNASPYDFPNLGPGSSLEIGFAVGEFSTPGLHLATNMLTYVLTISNQTSGLYTTTSTSGASSTSSTSSTTSIVTTSSTSSTTEPAGPSVLDYSLELAVIVVGFTFFVLVLMLRYQRS